MIIIMYRRARRHPQNRKYMYITYRNAPRPQVTRTKFGENLTCDSGDMFADRHAHNSFKYNRSLQTLS